MKRSLEKAETHYVYIMSIIFNREYVYDTYHK